ncbi:MAG: DUF11 domain-containing protein [Chloroflexi bacterium]|nr:MAG: DUF11 domain-containing protein [Chloroflexota bacterium]
MWIGLNDGGGVIWWNGHEQKKYSLPSEPEWFDVNIMALHIDSNGEILLGTRMGAATIDEETGKIVSLSYKKNRLSGKPNTQVPNEGICPVGWTWKAYFMSWKQSETAVSNVPVTWYGKVRNHDFLEAGTAAPALRMSNWYCNGNKKTGGEVEEKGNLNDGVVVATAMCSTKNYVILWSAQDGYQRRLGVGVDNSFTNGRPYAAFAELIPSDFGDLDAELESDFSTTNMYLRQRWNHNYSSKWTGGGNITLERLPNNRDDGDDALTVWLNGAYRNPETVTLIPGRRYLFRVSVSEQADWGWGSNAWVNAWLDTDGVSSGVSSTDQKGIILITPFVTQRPNGFSYFWYEIPMNIRVANPWLRLMITHESLDSDMSDGYTPSPETFSLSGVGAITGEVEDYRLNVRLSTDLSITKSDSPDPVIAGNNLTWTLRVTNSGPGQAQNVRVTDTIPAGLRFQSASGGGFNCSYNSGSRQLTCTRATMNSGQTSTINVVVTVPPDYTSNRISNTASVTSDATDTNPGNNQDTEVTAVAWQADLSITKSDSPDPVMPGEALRYTLVVRNNGPSSARNVVVQDVLPPGLNYVGVTPPTYVNPAPWSCNYDAPSRAVTCTVANLPPWRGDVTILLDTTVTPTHPGGGTITNTVVVTSDTPDPDSGDNLDSEDTTVDTVWGITPPSGYVFAHIKVSDEIEPGSQDQKDYLSDQFIPVHLQVPVAFGLAFHTDSAPTLCTVNADPCPPDQRVEGTVVVRSFSITEVEELETGTAIPLSGNVTMNRYSEPSIPDCTLGRCVAFGAFTATNYQWVEPTEYIYLYWQHPNGESLDCPSGYQCQVIPDSEPGYYVVWGTVVIVVEFPGYPELRRTYTLDGTAYFEVIVPFPQPRQ